jgi:hypothetical protein
MYVCTIYDTPAHAQIIIVDADLALRRGDVQAALNLLRKVEKASPHYTKARVVAANIHLTHRHIILIIIIIIIIFHHHYYYYYNDEDAEDNSNILRLPTSTSHTGTTKRSTSGILRS